MGLVTADKFSGKAANLTCQELGFQYAVDWVEFFVNDTYESTETVYIRLRSDYISLSNLYCDDSAGTFNDCSYNVTKLVQQQVALPVIILSCNPAPGEVSFQT